MGPIPYHGKAGDFTPADVWKLIDSQLLRALAPGARWFKALNNMTVPNLEEDPVVNGARRVHCFGRRNGAKKQVNLLEAFGICH